MEDEFDAAKYMFPDMQPDDWKRYCQHPSILVSEKERTVKCNLCGAILDPFQWILDNSKQQNRFRMNIKGLNDLISEKEGVLGELKRQERNARERLKRLTAENLRKIGGCDAAN